MMRVLLVSFVLWIAVAVAIISLMVVPAVAHEWYPWKCCSDKDCWVSPDGVTATAGGWRIETSGEIVPYDDARVHPTPPEGGGEFHVCHVGADPQARALCLFVPDAGA